MTERGRGALHRTPERFEVGPSSMQWEDGALTIEFDERAVPFPKRVRGRVRLIPERVEHVAYEIAPNHHWRPVAPSARIEVDIPSAGLSWRGHGYHDTNWGDEGLEYAFKRWDWSRGRAADGSTSILYDVTPRNGEPSILALRFPTAGPVEPFDAPPRARLGRGLWGVSRGVRADADTSPRLVRAFEDAPFYTRGELRSVLDGREIVGVHETFDGDRFARPWVKALLPFRMPRIAGGRR